MKLRRCFLLPLLLLIPILTACEVADQPDGWAAPTTDRQDPDQVILPTGEGRVVAIDILNNTTVWQFPKEENTFPGIEGELEPTAFYADPVWAEFTNEWLVSEYEEGVIYAIRPEGGDTTARIVFNAADLFDDARIVAPPLLDPRRSDRLYVTTTDYRVSAIHLESPPSGPDDLIWSWQGESEHPVWGGPALVMSEGRPLLVLAGLDGRITALALDDAEAGEVVWTRQLSTGVASAIVSHDGVLYFGAFDRTFYALDPRDGDTLWSARGSNWFWSTPVIDNSVVYAADLDGNLYAWDAQTGVSRWDSPYAAGERIRARPIVIDDVNRSIVIVARDGVVHQIDIATGASLWRSADVIDDDVLADALYRSDELFISDESGRLFRVILGINAAEQLYPLQDG